MSISLRLNVDDYEQMIANGAFVLINRRLEFIHREIREMSPAGSYHYDYIGFLNRWSTSNTTANARNMRDGVVANSVLELVRD